MSEAGDIRRRYAPACLIVLGIEPRVFEEASKSAAGIFHLELEDGVPPDKKVLARQRVREALHDLDWSGKLTMVRVNGPHTGLMEDDIDAVADARPGCIFMTKIQGADDVKYGDRLIARAEQKHKIEPGSIKIFASIERIRALASVEEIAACSPRLIGLSYGGTDLGEEVGYRRNYLGLELETLYAKSRMILAAHLNGLMAMDAPIIVYNDPEETYAQANWACQLGFDAKKCAFPYQAEIVNRAFGPSATEIKWAKHLTEAIDKGVMPDEDYGFVKRARLVLAEVEAGKRLA